MAGFEVATHGRFSGGHRGALRLVICSTPNGITENHTSGPSQVAARRHQVLNAWRHHENHTAGLSTWFIYTNLQTHERGCASFGDQNSTPERNHQLRRVPGRLRP